MRIPDSVAHFMYGFMACAIVVAIIVLVAVVFLL